MPCAPSGLLRRGLAQLVTGVCPINEVEKLVLRSDTQLLEETKRLFRGARLEAMFGTEPLLSELTDDKVAQLITLSKITSSE